MNDEITNLELDALAEHFKDYVAGPGFDVLRAVSALRKLRKPPARKRPSAHLVVELDAAAVGEAVSSLVLVSAGIYSEDHMGLTCNLKRVGATIFSAEGETLEEAEKRVMDWVRLMDQDHLPAWKQLAGMLERRR